MSVQEKKFKTDFQDGSHLGFLIGTILGILLHKSPWHFLASFKSVGFQFKRRISKTDFQDGSHGGHFRFPIRTISAIPDLQVNALILPAKFQVNWPFSSRKEVQNRFSKWKPWQPSWILDLNYVSSFWSTVQVAPIFLSMFWVSGPLGWKEIQNRFSRWWRWLPSWILDLNDLSYFWSTSHPDAFYQVSSQLAFWFKRRSDK